MSEREFQPTAGDTKERAEGAGENADARASGNAGQESRKGKSAGGITLVMPCYNEAQRLPRQAILDFAQSHTNVNWLFVDDGSTDTTHQILTQLAEVIGPHAQVLPLSKNSGKAEAVRQGILAAIQQGCDVVSYWDADLATSLQEALPMHTLLEQDPSRQLVMASRVKLLGRAIQRSAVRHYISRIFVTLVNLLLGIAVYDTQCGAKLIRVSEQTREVFAEPFHSRWLFDVEILLRLARTTGTAPAKLGELVREHPIEAWEDVRGSKVRARHYLIAIRDLLRIIRTHSK